MSAGSREFLVLFFYALSPITASLVIITARAQYSAGRKGSKSGCFDRCSVLSLSCVFEFFVPLRSVQSRWHFPVRSFLAVLSLQLGGENEMRDERNT